jgi:hypothetical protein
MACGERCVLRLFPCWLPWAPQEEQEELAAVEQEARGELRAAQQALAEAQEALAVTADKVSRRSNGTAPPAGPGGGGASVPSQCSRTQHRLAVCPMLVLSRHTQPRHLGIVWLLMYRVFTEVTCLDAEFCTCN